MNWWPYSATNCSGAGEVKPPRPQRMTLTNARQAGQYISPPEMYGVKIWGWDVLLDGRSIANMTASDLDIDAQRKTAERLCFAYNLEFGSDLSLS